jgi:predicted CXXCH cytochrome family protein
MTTRIVKSRLIAAAPFLLLLLTAPQITFAQDSDTVLLKSDARKFTILSRVDDPLEAQAFQALMDAGTAEKRIQLSNDFSKKYPRSWLLAQVNDLLARAAFDLGKYELALTAGQFSLRLLPENAGLLTLVANLEARQKDFKKAVNDASDAIEYLAQMEKPANVNQEQWEPTRAQLMASAYFARARAETSLAMDNKSTAQLSRPLSDLNLAAAWNLQDPEIFHLRAIVEIQLGQKAAAASDLAFVYRDGSALADKAKNILLILCTELAPSETSLEQFLRTLPERRIDRKPPAEPSGKNESDAIKDGYAGSLACRECHAREYSAWQKTGMARMLQPYRRENLLTDFAPGSEYSESTAGARPLVIRMGIENRPYFEFRDLGVWKRFYVDFTIGSKWQQAYATRLPDGQLQVFPIQYSAIEKKWINYWRLIDPPKSTRTNVEAFPKFEPVTNYQQNCAICHTSQLKADLGSTTPMQHAQFLQPGIDCEMCHGPSRRHIRQIRKGMLQHANANEPPVDLRRVYNREGVRICAQCHRQSAVREMGVSGEMNYSTKGSFIPNTWARPYDAFSKEAVYKDGRFRETTFIVEAFTRSGCYRRGSAQCASCHSPHLGDFGTNKTALKYANKPDEMCLGCHENYRGREALHSRHKAGSEAAQCVSCHMPRIMHALLFPARSHQIEIPTADLTERFGQSDSPNVCLSCHAEQSARWAAEQLSAWTGSSAAMVSK